MYNKNGFIAKRKQNEENGINYRKRDKKGAFANFPLPGGWAFANPGTIPELLTRTRFPIRI